SDTERSLSILPAVAVNKDGVVGVSWYRRGVPPDEAVRSVRFTASVDGGETFLPTVEVNAYPGVTRPKGPALYVFSGNSFLVSASLPGSARLGDTAGLAADAGGGFHPFWVD